MFVASTEFVDAARAQAEALGADPAAVFVAHPIQDRTDDEMRALADAAVDEILAALSPRLSAARRVRSGRWRVPSGSVTARPSATSCGGDAAPPGSASSGQPGRRLRHADGHDRPDPERARPAGRGPGGRSRRTGTDRR